MATRCRVEGRENIPEQGPLLVVANHLNLADPPLLSVSLTRMLMFMAKEDLFKTRFTGYFIRSFGAFPVQRGQADRKAIRQAGEILSDGIAVAMFPEATRSQDGRLQPAFPGSALIASRYGVPVLPVGISGTEKLKGPFWMFRRPRITVSIGQSFHLPPNEGKVTRKKLAENTDYIMRQIAGLLPPEQRGIYSKQEEKDVA